MTEALESAPVPPKLSPVEKLAERHILRGFNCGKASLDRWLKQYALKNQKLDSSQTYVVHRNFIVVGYYSLTTASIETSRAPARIKVAMPPYPIGVILLARLATDRREQKTGLGAALLKDAMIRCVSAADSVGARAVLVHALDEKARSFYEHYGFERCPENDMHLIILMQDLRADLFP
jgi:GNAT superfamily N-acetyltransferase